MNVSKETTQNVLRAIKEIVHGSTIKVGRNQYDFAADRLRIACTKGNLLAIINDYAEQMGSHVLSGDVLKGLMSAGAAQDAIAIMQWLREQPQMVISMLYLTKDELDQTIDAFVQAYESIITKPGNAKKRRPFEIGIRAEVEQALSHGDDKKAGNATLFRRAKIRTGAELPYYSANAIGGQMRDLLANHYLDTLSIPKRKSLHRWFLHLLYSGGIMADGAIPKSFERSLSGAANATVDVDGVTQLRDMIPFFSLLGGVGKYPLDGRVYINDLRPECIEWGNGNESIHNMIDWRYLARRDDLEQRVSKSQIGDDETLADMANASMLVNIECLCEGVVLEGGIDLSNHISDLEFAALSQGLLLLQSAGTLGGKAKRGFGRVAIEYVTTDKILNPKPYNDYLTTNKNQIVEYLGEIGALLDNHAHN